MAGASGGATGFGSTQVKRTQRMGSAQSSVRWQVSPRPLSRPQPDKIAIQSYQPAARIIVTSQFIRPAPVYPVSGRMPRDPGGVEGPLDRR